MFTSVKTFFLSGLVASSALWAQPLSFDTSASLVLCAAASGCSGGGDNVTFPVAGGGNLVLRHIPATVNSLGVGFTPVATNFGQLTITCVGCNAASNAVIPVDGATFAMRVNQSAPPTAGSQFVFGAGSFSGSITVTNGVASGSIQLLFATPSTAFGSIPPVRYISSQPVTGYLLTAGAANILIGTVQVESNSFDGPFQIRYFSNLNIGDGVVNITNTGARGAGLAAGTSGSTTGAFCVNVYVFSPDEQLVSCCSCPVTPNGVVALSARQDLISNTLTPAVPTSIIVKLNATVPIGGSCVSSATSPGTPAPGLAAWGTTVHAGPLSSESAAAVVTEGPFLPATLNQSENSRLGNLCTFIAANGSGFGICRSCRLGALGAGRI